jgi:hypothetical protein
VIKWERPVPLEGGVEPIHAAVGGPDPSLDAIVTPFSFARKIFDTAACGRRQGSALRSDRSRGKALTAVLAGQIINYPGEGKKERKSLSGVNQQKSPGSALTQNPAHYQIRRPTAAAERSRFSNPCQVCWRTMRWHNGRSRRSRNLYVEKVYEDRTTR